MHEVQQVFERFCYFDLIFRSGQFFFFFLEIFGKKSLLFKSKETSRTPLKQVFYFYVPTEMFAL